MFLLYPMFFQLADEYIELYSRECKLNPLPLPTFFFFFPAPPIRHNTDNKPLSAFTNGAATAANDNRERTSSGDSDVSDSWRAVTESAGVDLGAGELTRPCSTLSLADLGDLCGDAEGDDCGGAYLVGGDCDDSVDGGGIGLELLDFGGQEV